MIKELKNNDNVNINVFGNNVSLRVFSTGDSRFDENGDYKKNDFELNEKELELLNWLMDNINIDDYKEKIIKYCNEEYSMWTDKKITVADILNEVKIKAIAINVTKNWQAKDGTVYPEISFYGDCQCDDHGICIAFRDKEYIGIGPQDWTL